MRERPRSRDEALELLAQYFNLDDEALAIAEGWSILPPEAQRHVRILIDDHISMHLIPQLGELYQNRSHADQARANRIIEAVQDRLRGLPPNGRGD